MNWFQENLDQLGTWMKEFNSTGTEAGWFYIRGDNRIPLTEVTVAKIMMDEDIPQLSEIFLSDKRDLIFDTDLLDGNLPKVNDVIQSPIGFTFRVVPINEDQCFRYTSSSHKRIRVHTQMIDESKRRTT